MKEEPRPAKAVAQARRPLTTTIADGIEVNNGASSMTLTAADLGDTIDVRFSSTGSGAEGLQLTDLDFVAVPESSVALLGGLGVLGLLRRRRA